MKKVFLLCITIYFGLFTSFAQDARDSTKIKTKFDEFTSKTGIISKIVDINLPTIKQAFGGAESRIRRIQAGEITGYFFQIIMSGTYRNITASIEYSDLLEVIKALEILKSNVLEDTKSESDYLESRFTTDDGFAVGYYVKRGKATWFMQLEEFGADKNLYFKDVEIVEKIFTGARKAIVDIQN